jgi:uncharacterized protein (TIGR04255 family)
MFDQICYKKNPLNQVIVKVDFLAPLLGFETGIPPKLATLLANRFPIEDPGAESVDFMVAVDKEGVQASTHVKSHVYKYFGKEREKELSLSNKFLTIVQRKYGTYEAFAEDFFTVYKNLLEFFPDVQTSRFGLRYINILEMDEAAKPLKWKELINRDLIASAKFFQRDGYTRQVTRLFHVAELKFGDIDLRFQFGEPNPDFPAVMKKAQFVLDLDAYTQIAHTPENSFQYMEKAHMRIQELFEDSITEKLRSWLNA